MGQTATNGDGFKQGRRLLRAGEFATAADVLREYVADNPDDATAFEALGTACFAAGDNDGALQAFQRATQLMPREVRVFVNLGAVHNRRGEYNEALDVLRKALQKDRKSADAYYNMGLAHRGLDQLKMAVSAYREAIRLAPEMAEAYQNLGNVHFAMENYTQAVSSFQRALELRPKFERAQRGLERAEAALAEQRNPGRMLQRIVSPTARSTGGASADDATISADDLELIFNTALRAHDVAGELADHLETAFDGALKSLIKVVAEQSNSPMIDQQLQQFRRVVQDLLPQYQEVDVRVGQIKTLVSGELSG